jgi:hypothetical protein
MIIVIPVSKNDFSEPLNIFGFLKAFKVFGSYSNHELLVVTRPADVSYAKAIYSFVSDLFERSTLHIFEEDGPLGWPQGPNYYWKHTIDYLKNNNNDLPWLWMELDLLPLKPNWADILEKEYHKQGKPCLGTIQDTFTITSDMYRVIIAKHLQGTAVYPPDISKICSVWEYVDRIDKAFDVATQWEVIPNTADTKLIQQGFRTINYKILLNSLRIQGEDNGDMNGVVSYAQPIDPEAVLHHGCKDTSLADIVTSEDYKLFLK